MTAATARQTLLETRLLAKRSLRHVPRIPEKLADVTIQPIIFVLLFAYVFGSAIAVPGGGDYREYLVAGMFAQGMIGPLMGIAVGMAEDVHTGIVDRLRALPISRVAVLAGRALSELAQVVLGLVVFTACGLAVGWQPHGSVLETAAAYALLVLWAFAGVWVGTLLGMIVRDGAARERERRRGARAADVREHRDATGRGVDRRAHELGHLRVREQRALAGSSARRYVRRPGGRWRRLARTQTRRNPSRDFKWSRTTPGGDQRPHGGVRICVRGH